MAFDPPNAKTLRGPVPLWVVLGIGTDAIHTTTGEVPPVTTFETDRIRRSAVPVVVSPTALLTWWTVVVPRRSRLECGGRGVEGRWLCLLWRCRRPELSTPWTTPTASTASPSAAAVFGAFGSLVRGAGVRHDQLYGDVVRDAGCRGRRCGGRHDAALHTRRRRSSGGGCCDDRSFRGCGWCVDRVHAGVLSLAGGDSIL